jgi:fatty acid desaturase
MTCPLTLLTAVWAGVPLAVQTTALIIAAVMVALLALWLLAVITDNTVLLLAPRGGWRRPWCWLLSHRDDQDWEWDDRRGFLDVCDRCGRKTQGEED